MTGPFGPRSTVGARKEVRHAEDAWRRWHRRRRVIAAETEKELLRGSFPFNLAQVAVSGGVRARRLRPSDEEAGGPWSPRRAHLLRFAPEVQHLSQREVGAGTVADAVGERRDPHRVSSNLLCLGRVAGPAETRARAVRQRTARARRTTTPRSLQAARTCPLRRSHLRRAGGRQAVRPGWWHARRCAWLTEAVDGLSEVCFRDVAVASERFDLDEQRRPGRQNPKLVADLFVERAGVRKEELTVFDPPSTARNAPRTAVAVAHGELSRLRS